MRRRVDLSKLDLTTECAACGYKIPPAEVLRIDSERVQCSKCGVVMVPPGKKS